MNTLQSSHLQPCYNLPAMIYLDYSATTPVDPRVIDAMAPYFSNSFGNPSSVHRYGQAAEAAIDAARETVASILNCSPDEVIFTSCGSESDNLAIRGAAYALREKTGAKWILASRAEHPAVTRTLEHLEKYEGFLIEWLDVDEQGRVTPGIVSKAICENTAIVSVMYANKEITEVCRENHILFHTDAVQAAAYLPVDVQSLGVDMMSLGAHKFYGPKGVGALYVRKGTPLISQQTGGGQEFSLRAGTQNVPYIVGFAEALRLTHEEREQRTEHVKPLRDKIIGTVLETISDSQLTGDMENRLPHHASFAFKAVDGNLLLTLLDAAGFACSSGSACKTGNPEPSEVMNTIGLSHDWGLGSLRVTLGVHTTAQEIDLLLKTLPE